MLGELLDFWMVIVSQIGIVITGAKPAARGNAGRGRGVESAPGRLNEPDGDAEPAIPAA